MCHRGSEELKKDEKENDVCILELCVVDCSSTEGEGRRFRFSEEDLEGGFMGY